jgi:hypothetical protein
LHGIVQDLLQVFEAQTPPQHTQSQASSRRHTALSTEARPSIAWQGRAAAAVVALTEVLYGASPAWQPAQAQISSSPTSPDDSRRRRNGGRTCSTTANGAKTCSTIANGGRTCSRTANGGKTCPSTAAGDEAVGGAGQEGSRTGEEAGRHGSESASDVGASVHGDGALEQLVVQVLGDFSSADVWQLPTHVEPDASPGGTALTPQVSIISPYLLYSMGSLLPVCFVQSHRVLTNLATGGCSQTAGLSEY